MDEIFSLMVCYHPFESSLEGKTVSIQVEVVDASLYYNFLLERNWFYAMIIVASTDFQTLQFPHLGKIVTIEQLEFCSQDVTNPTVNNIPMLGQSHPPYQSIGVGMLKDSTLMGVFPSPPPSTEVAIVNMISMTGYSSKGKEVVDSSSLGPYEVLYDVVQSASDVQPDDLHLVASNPYHFPYWLEPFLPTLDYLT